MDYRERLTEALSDRYRIDREIGTGGMATVFLAQDLRHNRRVAVKVLKPELAALVGASRFLAEIETTAKLTHPHILPLFDSGQADGFLFFVMPFVDGGTLRDRLDREHQLPVAEAMRIISDLAEALSYAHRKGVVHRDIKPANILIHEGRALIADFGISLAVGSAGGARLTETGLSVGTPHYMSPEQATGDQTVGPASDIFALGCMLYEMLVGEPPYVGATTQAVLGKILSGGHVSATSQRPSIPPNVDGAIRKALEKLPADRFQSGRGFARALADPGFRYGDRRAGPPGPWKAVAQGLGAVAIVLAVVLAWALTRQQPQISPLHLPMQLPGDQVLQGGFDISRDGSFMVYASPSPAGSDTILWQMRLDSDDPTPRAIPNSHTSYPPQISPNGSEVAFYDGETIRILDLNGGGVARSVGGSTSTSGVFRWGPKGEWIYFHDNIGMAINKVRASGGPQEAEIVKEFPEASRGYWVYFDLLPSGRGAVVEVWDREGPQLLSLDLEKGDTSPLFEGRFPRYANGSLFYVSPDSVLMKVPFDPDRMEPTDGPDQVGEGVLQNHPGEWWYFAVSQVGRLLYATGFLPPLHTEFVWVTRGGIATQVDSGMTFNPGYDNRGFSLNHDGSQVAYSSLTPGTLEDVYVKPLPYGGSTRLTNDPGREVRPRWTPEGDSLVFIADVYDPFGLGVLSVPTTREEEPREILRYGPDLYEVVPSPDGEYLVVRTGFGPDSNRRDLLAFKTGTDSLVPLTRNEFNERAASFSPDGRFVLYESDETGTTQVYVRSFPDNETRKMVSRNGGVMPLWSHGGDEIFYVDPNNTMMVATVETDPSFEVTGYKPLFSMPENILFQQLEWYTLYDLSPDDKRFLMLRVVDTGEAHITFHFVQE